MSNVAPIKIDITNGKLPIKEKGLVFQEFASPAEERRNQLEKLAAGFRLFDYFGFNCSIMWNNFWFTCSLSH